MNDKLSLDGVVEKLSNEPLDLIKKSLITYNNELAKDFINKIIDDKTDFNIVLKVITGTTKLIGEAFANDELFLPDLIAAADTMQVIMPAIEKEILKAGGRKKTFGKVVIGTVEGDIHTIGKTMVGAMLKAGGFEVYDIGVDVSSDKFINAIKDYNPDILAMSALITTTAYEQKNIIEVLRKQGVREKVKIMVGGGAITQEFANSIGADGYDSTAPGAAILARKILGIGEGD